MGKVQDKLRGVKTFFTTDWNFVRLGRLVKRGVRAAPSGTKRYLVNKVPSAKWIPAYNLSWLAGDSIAGTTVGIVLALQAVNLAIPTPGGISIQQTLLASWLPGFIYAIMGTSKSKWAITSLQWLLCGTLAMFGQSSSAWLRSCSCLDEQGAHQDAVRPNWRLVHKDLGIL